jgi:hypothetical protein
MSFKLVSSIHVYVKLVSSIYAYVSQTDLFHLRQCLSDRSLLPTSMALAVAPSLQPHQPNWNAHNQLQHSADSRHKQSEECLQ